MNLKYMKVSLFEISYKKKWTFSRHYNLLRCTCMCPLQFWLKSRVPWTAWTLGCCASRSPTAASKLWGRDAKISSAGWVPLGLVTSCVVVMTDASNRGREAVCEGMPASGLWLEPQSRWHINRLELGAVFLALKDFRPQLEQRHVLIRTDNMRERRWICSLRARMRISRCSSPCLTPRWRGTRWHRTGQQPGCMRFLQSIYCHWCYARPERRGVRWY